MLYNSLYKNHLKFVTYQLRLFKLMLIVGTALSSRQRSVQSMDYTISCRYIGSDHLGIIHLDFARWSLLQYHGLAGQQGIFHLIESHTSWEESSRDYMFHSEFFGSFFVSCKLFQGVGFKIAKAFVHGSKYGVCLNTCNR